MSPRFAFDLNRSKRVVLRCLCFARPFDGQIPFAEPYANLFQERGGRLSTREDPDEIVRKSLSGPIHLQNHAVRAKFNRVRLKQDLEFVPANALLNALGVAILNARERLLPVGKCNRISDLVRQSHRGLYGRIAAADDQNVLVYIVIGLDQPVHDLRQIFPENS
jgi:hypothetical protein